MSDTFSGVDPQRLGTGDPDETKVLHGDGVWRVPTTGGITTITVTERFGSITACAATGNATATATCNAGEICIGGGFSTSASQILENGSDRGSSTSWVSRVRNQQGSSQNFTPYAMCLATS